MDELRCAGIIPSKVSFYGGIPSPMYAVSTQIENFGNGVPNYDIAFSL